MGFLQSYFKFFSRKFALQVLELAEEVGRQIPRWELKGYTPKEWLEVKSKE
ncbi:hypothetical protein J9317_02370 [Metabacillus sp. KIGAM252]|uniref:Uncharacterized protein n=1 Tax=Metabacillus flavus TaxID=2823519 RepID=A0ABS5LA58_9BACI|nr:hypothetical protein [Metabacillus flavus]MBS2967616.1 hypothetical protein [Metabacillus flavus]